MLNYSYYILIILYHYISFFTEKVGEDTETTVEKGRLDFVIKVFLWEFLKKYFFEANLLMNYILSWIVVNKSGIQNPLRTSFKPLLREKRKLPVFENMQTTNESSHLMTAMENGVISQFIVMKNESKGSFNPAYKHYLIINSEATQHEWYA